VVDRTRRIRRPDGRSVPRTLVTRVLYPATGPPSTRDVSGAAAQTAGGPYPLVVFGHGFGLLPTTYPRLLHAWARAGMVVAAPAFPLQNAHTPGGPVASDIVNQPADMRLLISRMLAASAARAGPFSHLIAPRQIAVGGHSNGASTARAIAYEPSNRDRRVSAVVLLSGAGLSGAERFRRGEPALMVVQGTADPVNPPASSYRFFAAAGPPKFLLRLVGAGHETPYTFQQPQLGIVERVTIPFFDRYLRGDRAALARLKKAARPRRLALLTANE
jgi:fermentation-respiration switch protein FrsA (DUF1100 family)